MYNYFRGENGIAAVNMVQEKDIRTQKKARLLPTSGGGGGVREKASERK